MKINPNLHSLFLCFLAPICATAGSWTTATSPERVYTTPTATNVGIGTTSPQASLDVRSPSGTEAVALFHYSSTKMFEFSGADVGAGGMLGIYSSGTDKIRFDARSYRSSWISAGNFGIGTTTPTEKLEVSGNVKATNFLATNSLGVGTTSPQSSLDVRSPFVTENIAQFHHSSTKMFEFSGADAGAGGVLGIYSSGTDKIRFDARPYRSSWISAGNFGIGTTTPTEKLEVSGNIKATNMIATNSITIKNWTIDAPDYVFDKKYALLPLSELEKSIFEKKHLPNIPSAKALRENGVNILEMNFKLLQKVEELTLYAIDQEKRIKKLEKNLEMGKNVHQ